MEVVSAQIQSLNHTPVAGVASQLFRDLSLLVDVHGKRLESHLNSLLKKMVYRALIAVVVSQILVVGTTIVIFFLIREFWPL